ncbi:DUF3616 domain-containing protein [Anabaena azotica]|uniref:DUF3616 domain-containing protein n=1 Tax=Anabaena azotica FACHB-119 TaxID=947527 RepID=A0ABR8DBK6_9NOST|nr:DUF3616 domain-containing protein [Anabaena azotica]MBD2503526.1 DUF3616 domain-containing protein [Anabaena azotica FACHB-119]
MVDLQQLQKVTLTFTNSFQKHREDISAVLLTQNQHLWLGSDETTTIERLSLADSGKFTNHQQFRVAEFIDLPAPEDEEIDIEGLAYADNYLWFVGSHSYKRKNVKSDKTDEENISRLAKVASEGNRYVLGRIPLVNGQLYKSCPHPNNPNQQLIAAKLELTKQGNILMSALADDPHLGFFVEAAIPGKDNGFDVEGLAVYENKVFLGLRGPVLRGWAIILEIELEDSSSGLMKLGKIGEKKQGYKKYFVWLNGLGIRDLCVVDKDLLILAGPTMDLDGPVQIYRLENGVNLQENILNRPKLFQEIAYGDRNDHAEGITLFDDISGVPSILVVYDSPAKERLLGDDSVIADVFQLS